MCVKQDKLLELLVGFLFCFGFFPVKGKCVVVAAAIGTKHNMITNATIVERKI